ncbi:sugar phosphate isomerase/epimerase family protein [Microbacterium kyungheense]|uniref:Sugar phosphate isomerase/epimerase n=1 Tax=Microbacterium kyungheense TaxID=1263636 RepID=A0A543FJ04_9MICO|nr:sugar phosphate isomerase/epimerase [Microbacterium kyungheense]TQM33850.1 sugar phosphate isomerase/epimerase [Microbacterium kyungheense]
MTNDTTWQLSGFGDEIDPDPRIQCAVLSALGARHVEVRSAWGTNIVDLDDDGLDALAATIRDAGMGVSAIASPIGKSELSEPAEYELGRLDRALRAADVLGSRYIRLFSFWCHEPDASSRSSLSTSAAARGRDEILRRMGTWAERAAAAGVTLVHENEKHIYGDVPERVLDIVRTVGSPSLRLAWDNANFVQVGVRPVADGWAQLAPYVEYLQVKDARLADGEVVPAGEGDGELRETIANLRDAGFSGFASLEPHLTDFTATGGFSGAAAFGRAARAFRSLTDHAGVTLA